MAEEADYTDIVQSLLPSKSAAKAGMLGGPAAPAQKALAVSQQTGLPAPTVLSDPDLFAMEAKRRKAASIIDGDDKIAKFFAANPVAAQAAQDDMPSVGTFSNALSSVTTGWKRGELEEERGAIGFKRGVLQDDSGAAELHQIEDQLKQLGEPTSWLDKMTQSVVGMGAGFYAHRGEALAGGMIGSVAPGLGTATGAMAGAGAGMARTAAGRSWLDSGAMRSSDGKELSVPTRLGLASLIGVANGAANVMGLKVGGEAIGKAIGFGVEEAVRNNPGVRDALSRAAGEILKGSAQGGAIVGSLTATTELLTDIAKSIEPGQWETIFNDPKRRAEALKTISDQTAEAMELFGALHVPAAGRSLLVDSYRIKKAHQDAAALDAAAEAAKGTPFVKGESEGVLGELIDHHTGGQQLGIPVDVVDKKLAADPNAFAWAPEVAAQLEQARAHGGDVEIPLSKLLTVAPEGTLQGLRDDLRLRKEGFTVNEAKEWTAFHGSGATFDKFDSKFRRSGEGQTVRGGGTYVAERRGIAESYFEQRATQDHYVGNELLDETNPAHVAAQYLDMHETPEEAIKYLKRDAALLASTEGNTAAVMEAAANHLEEGKPVEPMSTKLIGNLYQVRVKVDPRRMLHWDKPLEEQTPEVQAVLKRLNAEGLNAWKDEAEAGTGGAAYGELYNKAYGAEAMADVNRPEVTTHEDKVAAAHDNASAALRDAGLHGIQFYDAASRGEGVDRTHNLVIFHDDHLEITHVNGVPVPKAVAESPAGMKVRVGVSEETAKERHALWLDPLFRPDNEQNAIKLTAPEYKAYSDRLEKLQAAIELKAEKAAEAEVARRLKPEWKAELEKIKAEVEFSLRRQGDIAADAYFRDGTISDGKVPRESRFKLDADAVQAVLGSKDQLSASHVTERGGLHPDVFAEMFGYPSGQKLVEDLMALHRERQLNGETPAKQLKRRLDAETDRRMEERHGQLDQRIREEALDMVVQRAQLEVLGAELEHLNQGDTPLSRQALEARTHEIFATIPASSARDYKKFLGLVAKAGRAAEMALLKGKVDEAFLAKQRQFQASIMAQSAKAFERSFKQLAKTFDQFRDRVVPSVDQPFTDQIHRIMSDLGVPNRRDPQELVRAVADRPLDGFAKDREEVTGEGSLPVADFLYSTDTMPVFKESPASPRKEFTVEQFHALKDSIDVLAHAGREEKKIKLGEAQLELGRVVDEAHVRFATLDTKANPLDPNVFDSAKAMGRGWDVALLKVEQMFQWFDKNEPTGVFTKLFQRFASSKYAAHDMTVELGKQLKTLQNDKAFMKSLDNRLENTTLRDWRSGELLHMTGRDLVGLMLHIGNESNFEKLTQKYEWRGETHGFDSSDVLSFIQQHATKDHVKLVQGIWDINEKFFWPKVEEMYRRITGIAPDKIEPRPLRLTLKDGEISMAGGYVPLDRDPRWPDRGGDPGRGLFSEQRGRNALPSKGYTMARNGAAYPVAFDVLQTINGMRETIHDLAYRETLIDAKKFLDQRTIKEDIMSTFGKEYLDSIDPWLEHVATSRNMNAKELAMTDRAMRFMRQRLVTTELVGRLITLAKHSGMATLDTLGEVARQHGIINGPVKLLIEMGKLYGNPLTVRDKIAAIYERSGELRSRMHQPDRDLNAMAERVLLGNASRRDQLAYALSIPIMGIDQASAIPLFLVAERTAIERGMGLSDAAAYADTVVRNAHGSTGTPDLAPILRSKSEAYKLLTVAYNSFNHNYNRVRNIGREFRDAKNAAVEGNLAEGFGHFWKASVMSLYYVVLLAAYERWVTHSGPDEDKDEGYGSWLTMGLVHQNLGNFPMVRELGQMALAKIEGKQAPTGTPISSFFKAGVDAATDLYKLKEGEDPSPNWVSHFARGVGYLGGVPGMGQVAVTSQNLYDLSIGRQHAEDPGQLIRGIISGKSDPHATTR